MSSPPREPSGDEGPAVDDLERLSSYLDEELDADGRAALEAALAGDLDLRSQLERLAGVDRSLAAALPPAELPEGARLRLDAALHTAFEERMAPGHAAPDGDAPVAPTTAEASGRPIDELATRRRPRRRAVMTAGIGVAAGLVLLAGGIVGVTQLDRGPGGTADEVASLQADQLDGMEAEADAALRGDEVALAGDLPVVIDERRTGSTGDSEALLDDPQLRQLAQQGLPPEQGASLAAEVQDRLLGGDRMTSQAPEAEDDNAVAPLVTRDGVQLDEAVTTSLRRCLAQLLEPGEQAVPVAIELLTPEQGQAAMFGLLTLDPGIDAFSRLEVWTLDLDSCQVLQFDQS